MSAQGDQPNSAHAEAIEDLIERLKQKWSVQMEILTSFLTPEQLASAQERWEHECAWRGWSHRPESAAEPGESPP
jgi:hypothetical protein